MGKIIIYVILSIAPDCDAFAEGYGLETIRERTAV